MVGASREQVSADFALITEALALKKRVELAMESKFQKVIIVETNSGVLYRNLKLPKRQQHWRIRPIVHVLLFLWNKIPLRQFRLIKRKANQTENWVATLSKMWMCDLGWLRLPPSSLVEF
ncbi:hypothetical protein REPUB_Repub19eG0122900 [Reevesia pubescens]